MGLLWPEAGASPHTFHYGAGSVGLKPASQAANQLRPQSGDSDVVKGSRCVSYDGGTSRHQRRGTSGLPTGSVAGHRSEREDYCKLRSDFLP